MTLTPIKHAAHFHNGAAFKPSDWGDEGLPILRIAQLSGKPFDNYFDGNINRGYLIKDGDLLFSWSATIDAFIWDRGDAILNQHIFKVVPKKNADKTYLYYLIKAHAPRWADDDAHGSTMRHIKKESLSNKVWLPNLPTQKRIAAFLDRETARIDALIAKKERLVEVLQEERFSTISRSVTVGLNPDLPLEETGNQYIPRVTKGWKVWRLKHLASVFGGITLGRKIAPDENTIATPYLRVANVQAGWLDLSDIAEIDATIAERKRYALAAGDVLMNEGGDNDKLGRGAVWQAPFAPCINQNHVFAVRPKDKTFSRWISLTTNAQYARDFFYLHSNQSTNLASISKTNLQKFPLAVPPKEEMLAVLGQLDEKLSQLELIVTKTDKSVTHLREYRAALITAAVTGQIEVDSYTSSGAASAKLDQIEEEIQG
ncbi:restriction endonuclease subunit S [Shimia sp. MIT910701]|uniref:restriction endonuclease subunit S n=1 Tax=Shimia sp. MIT910701 TaxID=3096987 RepID=UPI003999F3C8